MLAKLFYRLIFHLTAHDVPLTFLHFPRFANDPAYFVKKLSSGFGQIDPGRLESALRSEVQQELITDFLAAIQTDGVDGPSRIVFTPTLAAHRHL